MSPGGTGYVGKAIAEVGHRELQPIGQLGGPLDRAGHIGEQRRHVRRRLEIPLGVRRQAPPRVREIGVVVNAREHVEQRTVVRRREPDAAGRQDGHAKGRRQIDEPLVVRVFVAPEMPLHLDVHLAAAEHPDQAVEQAADAVPIPVERRAADQRHQPADVEPSSSSSVSAPSPFGARSFIRVIRRHRFRYPSWVSQRTGRVNDGEGWSGGLGWSGGSDRASQSFVLPLPASPALPVPPASAIVSSAPMIGRIPAARAAL